MEDNNSQTVMLKLEKGYVVAVASALIVVCCIVAAYFIVYAYQSPGYHEMYLLDAQNQAVNYPKVLVINQNNTFNTPVTIVNNTPILHDYQVQTKIVQDTIHFPINATTYKTYEFALDTGQSWSSQVPISINEEGSYSIVFELYAKNGENYVFTNNFCVLHIEVVTGTT
ncbi:MAG: DUF1616 domain-containing protein [Candidatus Bathyarchaeota archaeon]|nr:DUF1616 domain-containing protein [Candidatus Termiticorpusculum sp.]